jgi:hypothetical protein
MTDQLYQCLSKRITARIKQIDKVDEFDLTKIDRGILSIHASWSGQSIMYGKSILSLIDNSRSTDFEIHIIDIDTISPEKQIELFGSVCHGYFESFWIENGKIEFIYRDNNKGTELGKFMNYLNEKLNLYPNSSTNWQKHQ